MVLGNANELRQAPPKGSNTDIKHTPMSGLQEGAEQWGRPLQTATGANNSDPTQNADLAKS